MMFLRLLAFLSVANFSWGAVSLKPGDRFPEIEFPPIAGGEGVTVSSFGGKKLMLHLFASW